jgi:hypothetical protein
MTIFNVFIGIVVYRFYRFSQLLRALLYEIKGDFNRGQFFEHSSL